MGTEEKLDIPHLGKIVPEQKYVKFGQVSFMTALAKVPEGTAYKGSILFVHGFAEFVELYGRVQGDLAAAGYENMFFDQRGSGHTSPDSWKGRTNEHYSFKDLDNMIKMRLEAIESNPNQKLYLVGHSMGGGISLNYSIHGTYRDKLAGIAVTAPLVDLEPTTKPNIVLRLIMPLAAKIVPNIKVDSAIQPKNVTSDEEYQKYLMAHEICKPIGTIALYHGMISRGLKLMDPEYVKDQKKDLPVLIMHSVQDKINDFNGSRKFVEISPAKDVTLKKHEVGEHSLLFERDEIYQQVLGELTEWLDAH